MLRYAPLWGMVRPFAGAVGGLAVLWHGAALENSEKTIIEERDEQRSAAVLYGAALGIDWRLHTLGRRVSGTYDIVLTTCMKRLYTSRMERPSYDVDADGTLRTASERTSLAIWVPALALTLSIDSRASAGAMP